MTQQHWLWILGILVIYLAFFHQQKFEGMTAEEWFYAYDEASSDAEMYQDALYSANSNIDDAKSAAWGTYYEMGEALDYLETVEP